MLSQMSKGCVHTQINCMRQLQQHQQHHIHSIISYYCITAHRDTHILGKVRKDWAGVARHASVVGCCSGQSIAAVVLPCHRPGGPLQPLNLHLQHIPECMSFPPPLDMPSTRRKEAQVNSVRAAGRVFLAWDLRGLRRVGLALKWTPPLAASGSAAARHTSSASSTKTHT
ncbi:hypothetical protein E2C01_051581 [Portunus trituberculatus]|uniref:Uncharacterized protein n=1 Tax=Portunus trituberculatus TaxID=210409 RepID=A0A5B7GJY6_PORTR|nr:hypothetical protein [Portunus trituberculatus]